MTRTVTIRANTSGTITNLAVVAATETDPNTTNNRAAAVTTVLTLPQISPVSATVAVNATRNFNASGG